jgi:CHAT domain-containing protein
MIARRSIVSAVIRKRPSSGRSARAFFYAGARTLLVSHWAVDSQATVSLVTKAFDEIKDDDRIGRGEALRRSMLSLISSGGRNAHPANWAPFVVVGEGAK